MSELPFHEYARQSLAGDAELVLSPPPPRLQGMRFGIGPEHPIALLDDTVMSSCKAGALLTNQSLWILADGRRVDVSILRGGPYFPHGDEYAGFIDTSQGPFAIPPLSTDAARSSMERLVEVAVEYARGERASPYERLVRRGPISHAIATTLLTYPKAMPPWNISKSKRTGLRVFSRGMDHLGGEEALAVLDETTLGKCDEGVLFSDRALYVRSETSDELNENLFIPYGHILGVGMGSSVFGEAVQVNTSRGIRTLKLITNSEGVAYVLRFLQWLCTLPPQSRWEPRPAETEPKDDLEKRLDLQERNERWGRGAREGWALSPLSYADLRHALTGVLGQPFGQHWDGRVETLDFTLRGGGGTGAAGAVASSVVGIALFATLGVGWISIPKGPTITSVRVRGTDLPGGAGISVSGFANGQMEVALPEVADAVDKSLLVAEREILRRRQAYGLAMPMHELLSRP